MPPPPRTVVSGKLVLLAVIGLALFISVGAMLVALATRRPLSPAPMPRHDRPVTGAPSRPL